MSVLDVKDPFYKALQKFTAASYVRNFITSATQTTFGRGFELTIRNPGLDGSKLKLTYAMLRPADQLELLYKYREGKLEMPTFLYRAKEDERWLISGLEEYLFLTQKLRITNNFHILQKRL